MAYDPNLPTYWQLSSGKYISAGKGVTTQGSYSCSSWTNFSFTMHSGGRLPETASKLYLDMDLTGMGGCSGTGPWNYVVAVGGFSLTNYNLYGGEFEPGEAATIQMLNTSGSQSWELDISEVYDPTNVSVYVGHYSEDVAESILTGPVTSPPGEVTMYIERLTFDTPIFDEFWTNEVGVLETA